MKDTEGALKWIVGILRDHNIPFQISGGFAARMYGSMRELADIDIDVAEDRLNELADLVKEHSVYGLQHYTDDQYDLMIIQLTYRGQDIDIVPETVRFFSSEKKKWVTSKADLRQTTEKEIFGIEIPVIPVDQLIKYKLELRRDVDLQDVEELRKLGY